jgi:hypothetical protein
MEAPSKTWENARYRDPWSVQVVLIVFTLKAAAESLRPNRAVRLEMIRLIPNAL